MLSWKISARYENELLRYIDHLYVNRYKPENNKDLLTIGLLELLITNDPVSLDIIVSHQNQAVFVDSLINAYHKFLRVFSNLWDSREIWLS
jgi:hypothetical protein